jgi:beta-phosphoglucomutase-like phosphatase (HAD superfamily)
MLAALLFDLDGTLANTDHIHFQNWQELLRAYGVEINQALFKAKFSGRRNREIIQDFLPQLSPAATEQLSWQKEAMFRERAGTLAPTAGLLERLAWAVEQNIKTAVVTNAPVENVERVLQVLGVTALLPTVILGDQLPKGKPDPLPYQVALERLEVSAIEAIAFEDSVSGIASAVAAGILTVGIASTQEPQNLYAEGVTLAINDFSDPRLTELLHQRRFVAESATP